MPHPTPPFSNANNANNWQKTESEANNIDNTKRDELEVQNEKFRQIPDEFKNVDFKNFRFPIAKLKNGEFEIFNPNKPTEGRQVFGLENIYYIDLNGDDIKEAIVFLYAVSCGGSCDGGRSIIYFYSSQNGKPTLIDTLEMGSRSSGCSLKSFALKDKKISVEQFGSCKENSTFEKDRIYTCKFCVKNLTRSDYHFEKNYKLIKDSVEEIETPEVDVMNYTSEIGFSE